MSVVVRSSLRPECRLDRKQYFGLVMGHQSTGLGLIWPLAIVIGVSCPASALAATPLGATCAGTVLQLSIQEQGLSAVDRFRFSLGVSGDGASESAALQLLNQRLRELRSDLNPLLRGQLTVLAPRSHQRGEDKPNAERLYVANTTLSGEVGREHYDALIQLAGRRPGVRLQSMKSLADVQEELNQEQVVVKRALQRGLQEAQLIGRSIGRSRVSLKYIDRRGTISRPLQARLADHKSLAFDPNEAPKPQVAVHVQLTYCLS